MGKDSAISWTHHTFNAWWGCQKVSDGCKNCYAIDWAERSSHPNLWGPPATTERRTFGPHHWHQPVLLDRAARKANVRERIFLGSMCDWAEDHPTANAERAKVWPLIRATENLDWLLLTKRPDRILSLLPDDWGRGGYPNVWMGTSVEDMRVAWRLKALGDVPAVVRFVSYEPALGPLDALRDADVAKADWWIYGGESGDDYRRDSDDWAHDIRVKCERVGSTFYFKQTSARISGQRPTLAGKTYHRWPVPRTVPLPDSYRADQGGLFG